MPEIKSKERKEELGEVYAPQCMVEFMLDKFDVEIYRNDNIVFYEPCSGPRGFIIEVLKRRFTEGVESLTALENTYAADIDPENIRELQDAVIALAVDAGIEKKQARKLAARNFFVADLLRDNTWRQKLPVKVDFLIANPPYQDAGGVTDKENNKYTKHSTRPLYQKFIYQLDEFEGLQQAVLIFPSRWMFGSKKDLVDFRKALKTTHLNLASSLKEIYDFPAITGKDAVFAGASVDGGVNVVIWKFDEKPSTRVEPYNLKTDFISCNYNAGIITTQRGKHTRPLFVEELDEIPRSAELYDLWLAIKKSLNDKGNFASLVSQQQPFGLVSNFDNFAPQETGTTLTCYVAGRKTKLVEQELITRNKDKVNMYKVGFSLAGAHPYLYTKPSRKTFIMKPNEVSTQTYQIAGGFRTKKEAGSCKSYMDSKFFRACQIIICNTYVLSSNWFLTVPLVPFDREWNDVQLFDYFAIPEKIQKWIQSFS